MASPLVRVVGTGRHLMRWCEKRLALRDTECRLIMQWASLTLGILVAIPEKFGFLALALASWFCWTDRLATMVLIQLLGMIMATLVIGLSREISAPLVVLPRVSDLVARKVTLEELMSRVPFLIRAIWTLAIGQLVTILWVTRAWTFPLIEVTHRWGMVLLTIPLMNLKLVFRGRGLILTLYMLHRLRLLDRPMPWLRFRLALVKALCSEICSGVALMVILQMPVSWLTIMLRRVLFKYYSIRRLALLPDLSYKSGLLVSRWLRVPVSPLLLDPAWVLTVAGSRGRGIR